MKVLVDGKPHGEWKPIPPDKGPGTELKKLLARFGIKATPTCACNKMARKMNERGAEWCMGEGMEGIVKVMAAEAAKRHMPFSVRIARLLVRRAVQLACKSAT